MKLIQSSRHVDRKPTYHALFVMVCAVALSCFMITPAFAQRGESSRDKKTESKQRRSATVRVDQQRGSRSDNRGNATQVTSRDNSRNSVNPSDVRTSASTRVSTSRSNSNSYQVRDNRPYEPRYDRYGRWPSRGTTVRVMPQGGIWREYNGVRYVYRNGFYYKPYGSSYVVVAPPIGFRISALPIGFISFTLANAAYYYYAGTYYQRYNTDYVVVQPPLGALVQSIPEGGQQVVVDGNTFYIVDGIQYQAVLYNGSIWYKVIKIENQVDGYNGENPY